MPLGARVVVDAVSWTAPSPSPRMPQPAEPGNHATRLHTDPFGVAAWMRPPVAAARLHGHGSAGWLAGWRRPGTCRFAGRQAGLPRAMNHAGRISVFAAELRTCAYVECGVRLPAWLRAWLPLLPLCLVAGCATGTGPAARDPGEPVPGRRCEPVAGGFLPRCACTVPAAWPVVDGSAERRTAGEWSKRA